MIAALLLAALPAHAADRVSICHHGDDGVSLLTVSENAVDAHLEQHGDTLAGAWYPDADGDGHGEAGAASTPCPAAGLVESADDCDDADPTVHPGAAEECGDGQDDTCDGVVDEGCEPTCPCFSAEDLDATWAELESAELTWSESLLSASCWDRAPTSASVTITGGSQEWRRSYFGDHDMIIAYERDQVAFASYGPGTSTPGCAVVTRTSSWVQGGTPTYEEVWDRLATTEEEAVACGEVALAWAAARGLTCN